jgi:tetratricopeptide (TPR) repeat protein
MAKHRIQFIWLVVTVVLSGSASSLRAQEGFKGERRPPNPEVHRPPRAPTTARAGVKQTEPTTTDPIEAALERGNKLTDEARHMDAPPELYRNNFRPAEAEYRKVLALNPNEARGYFGLGNALAGQARYDEAEAAYGHALLLNPRYVEVYLGLGDLPHSEQMTIDYYKKAISIKPNFIQAYISIAEYYTFRQRESEAIPWYQEAARQKPDSGPGFTQLGSVLDYLKRYEEAIQQYKEAIRLRDVGAYAGLASVYQELKRYPEAIAVYKQWIRFKPSGDAYEQLGDLYDGLERYPEAVAAYQQMVRLEPDNDDYHHTLGLAYLKVKNKRGAMKEYLKLKKAEHPLADDLLEEINKP